MSVWLLTIDSVVTYDSFVVSLNNDNGPITILLLTKEFAQTTVRQWFCRIIFINIIYEFINIWTHLALFIIMNGCIWRLYAVWWVGGLLLSVYAHNTITEQHRFGSILFPLGFLGFSFGFVKAVSALIHNNLDNVIL